MADAAPLTSSVQSIGGGRRNANGLDWGGAYSKRGSRGLCEGLAAHLRIPVRYLLR